MNTISSAAAVDLHEALQTFEAEPEQCVSTLSAAGDRWFTSAADVTDLPEMWRAILGVGLYLERTDRQFSERRKPRFAGK